VKNNKRHIIPAWILLLCFIAGQYMVYAHQHKLNHSLKQTYSVSTHHAQPTITEKCKLCDAMHHYNAVNDTQTAPTLLPVENIAYVSPVYNFTSLSLILASGRAPPSACYSA
jgi:hypothetical protein